MNTNSAPIPAVRAEALEIDLMDEFDFDDSNQQTTSTHVVAEEFDHLITEFDNAEIVEDISVTTTAAALVPATASAVYLPAGSPTIPVAETTTALYTQNMVSTIPLAETTTALYNNNSLDDDEMLVEAIEIISCDFPENNMYTLDDGTQVENSVSQFVEYSTDPFESKQAIAGVQQLHDKMDTFMSDNNMFGSNEYLEDDDIEVFASMMQTLEQEHIEHAGDQVENKQIMQAMIVSNQEHVQEVNALQQQQEDIAVQIGPICTAPFQPNSSDLPQFSMGCSSDSTVSNAPKKKTCKKKKEKRASGGGFAAESEEDYETQKNVLRQEATAKRTRTAGKFAKRKIEWMSITEAMKNNNT
jgi:hypothetical protein